MKKILALILALLMLVSTVAFVCSCGEDKPEDDPKQEQKKDPENEDKPGDEPGDEPGDDEPTAFTDTEPENVAPRGKKTELPIIPVPAK